MVVAALCLFVRADDGGGSNVVQGAACFTSGLFVVCQWLFKSWFCT